MAKQTFQDVTKTPPLADQTTVTATVETAAWTAAAFTPVFANDPEVGKIYRVSAGGTVTTAATGTLVVTPRYGTSTGGLTLGASAAQTTTASLTTQPWILQFDLVFRAISSSASSSTATGAGYFLCQGVLATAGSAWGNTFGGTTVTTADTTTNQGIFIGVTFSVAPSFICKYAFIQTLN